MKCSNCGGECKKAGKQKNGAQKYRCKSCKKYRQADYRYRACKADMDKLIIAHVKEGCGIMNTARLLGVAKGTVLSRIRAIAAEIEPPKILEKGLFYEVDELYTFAGSKANPLYICYAIERKTRQVVDFTVGARTKENLQQITEKLLNLSPLRVFTDSLNIYRSLIPAKIHYAGKRGTLRIERQNLSLRTNLKRLARKTIGFSRSAEMLEACLKIWFWA